MNFSHSFEDYVAVDNSIATAENITEDEIVQSVLASKGVKEEEEDDDEDKEELGETDRKNVPSNTTQCLEAIAGIRTFFQSSSMPENVFDALTLLEDYAMQMQI